MRKIEEAPNRGLHNLYSSPDITVVIKSRITRLAGDVANFER
jgi:hypothetical protein